MDPKLRQDSCLQLCEPWAQQQVLLKVLIVIPVGKLSRSKNSGNSDEHKGKLKPSFFPDLH